MAQLDGRVVLITGGAKGQGAAESELFVAEGAKVAVCDLDREAGEELVGTLGEAAAFLELDVSDEAAWERTVKAVRERFGKLDGLINNAGIYEPGEILETSVELIEKHHRVNLLGTFLGMKHGGRAMRDAGGGTIVNISSIAGIRGFPGAGAYVATKWGVRGITRTAASELAPHGIRVNAILPGFIDTAMLEANEEEMNRKNIEETPLKRAGEPGEIARLALFLSSEASAFMTGTDSLIDGGWSL